MRLMGTVMLTENDIINGSKSFNVHVYDDDAFSNDLLDIVQVTVPTTNGVPGMYTPFIAFSTLMNSTYWLDPFTYHVFGFHGSSGEEEAEVFFSVPDGSYSNTAVVTAVY